MSDYNYEYGDGLVDDGEAEETWQNDEQEDFIPADEFVEYLQQDDEPAYIDLSAEQGQLESSLGRELNGTELMALQNALDQGVEGTLSELYDMYREIRGTPEGREALMKARLQELRES
jgi:hypothetical protein